MALPTTASPRFSDWAEPPHSGPGSSRIGITDASQHLVGLLGDGPGSDTLRVSVHMDSMPNAELRRYGMEELLSVVGVRPVFERTSQPLIYYGHNPVIGNSAAVWISANSRELVSEKPYRLTEVADVPVMHRGQAPKELFVGNRLHCDIPLATAFWLTLQSERSILHRDAHGRVPACESLLAIGNWLQRPPVQIYADLLADRLSRHILTRQRMPRWPFGKKYAVALTHDVDTPESTNRLPRLLRETLFFGNRPRRAAYWDLRAELRSRSIREAIFAGSSRCREWDFAEVCEFERRCGVRSAFYFAVVDRTRGHPRDVSYQASRARFRRLFKRLDQGDWEIGLHASYQSCLGTPNAKSQVERLAALTKRPIAGVRHHYLRLNPNNPISSLFSHADAGLQYDSSIGFNDAPGFRAGTALPFQPFDPQNGEACSLVELPMSIADMHLPTHDEDTAINAVLGHLQTVESLGGLAVLDWHAGQWHSHPAWRAAYCSACRLVSHDPDVWVAKPRDIAQWWLKRSIHTT